MGRYGATMVKGCVDLDLKAYKALGRYAAEHKAVVDRCTRQMGSFEHIETRIAPVSKAGTHRLRMKFRARNGFGGMSVGSVLAVIENDGCRFRVLEVVSQ